MVKKHPLFEIYGEQQVSAFGIEVLRTVVIPELLGEETSSILYWSGRKLARHYFVEQITDLPLFFERAGWGELELKEEKKDACSLVLTSDLISARLKDDEQASFSLESGFLAEQFEYLTKCVAECYTEVKTGKTKKILFQIKWDPQDPSPVHSNSSF